MWTLKQIIERGRAEVGQEEQPLGSNCIKYNDWYYGFRAQGDEFPWCAAFMSWLFLEADTGIAFPRTPACVTIYNFAKERGQLAEGDYRPGDIVIYRYNAWSKTFDHTGLVVERCGEMLVVLEGNYADKVCLVNRNTTCIIGAYRPQYGEDDEETGDPSASNADSKPDNEAFLKLGDEGTAVAVLQYALHARGYNCSNSRLFNGDWDGEFGAGTQAALDRCCGKSGTVCTEELFVKLCKGEKL